MTGNVTALHFVLSEEMQTSEIGPFAIEFLDHEGFEDCLDFMLAEARQRAKVAEVRGVLRERLEVMDPHLPETTEALESWCREAWSTCSNPGFRFLIREILAFTRAYRRCGTGVCGSTFEVSPEVAREGLTLPDPPRDIQATAFDELPKEPPLLSSRPDELTSRMMLAVFPLIRRVRVQIRLSRQIWDFADLTDANPFVLLDFPGLGAANSGVRDLYLCLRELEEVQTLLILLDATKPGGNEGARSMIFCRRIDPARTFETRFWSESDDLICCRCVTKANPNFVGSLGIPRHRTDCPDGDLHRRGGRGRNVHLRDESGIQREQVRGGRPAPGGRHSEHLHHGCRVHRARRQEGSRRAPLAPAPSPHAVQHYGASLQVGSERFLDHLEGNIEEAWPSESSGKESSHDWSVMRRGVGHARD